MDRMDQLLDELGLAENRKRKLEDELQDLEMTINRLRREVAQLRLRKPEVDEDRFR